MLFFGEPLRSPAMPATPRGEWYLGGDVQHPADLPNVDGSHLAALLPSTWKKSADIVLHMPPLPASVPIPKFPCTFCVCVECAAAEAFDGCEDGVGGFCPAERLGRGISDFEIKR
jgi:hypothetical protein